MIYPANFEQKIGFDRVREQVAALCSMQVARDIILGEKFSTSRSEIERRQETADEMRTLLMLDPAAFEDPNQLDREVILKSALWATLLENRTKYNYDENGMLLVPASDLDVAAKKLYGSKVSLEHKTFSEGYDFFYLYDEETNRYSVPTYNTAQSTRVASAPTRPYRISSNKFFFIVFPSNIIICEVYSTGMMRRNRSSSCGTVSFFLSSPETSTTI